MKIHIPVENGNLLEAVRLVLKRLLESELIDALMVPLRSPSGAVVPALVTEPDLLAQADPLAPVFSANAARLLGWMTQREPRGRIGAVMRSCEMRALVELVKLQQACADCVTLVSVDCAGTYDVPVYMEMIGREGSIDPVSLYGAAEGTTAPLRDGCLICEKPVYDQADIVLELFGSDLAQGFTISTRPDLGKVLGFGESTDSGDRSAVVEKLVAGRKARLEEALGQIRKQMSDEGIDEVFGACIRCHNCMTVCPICYCKTCLFKGPVFDHDPIQYLQWAENKGALRLPSDTMLFHLTRMNHMALSCVGCGMCTSACPADLPVGRVFRAIGGSVQAAFGYEPGRDIDEELPLITFQENEWLEVGK